MQWNCCVEEMCSQLQPLQFEGSIAREHESFVSTSSILGIGRKSRTKASFSDLQRLECQSSLARKHRFYIFNSWTWKEASRDSFVFTNHGCDLNVRICRKHCVFFLDFSGKRTFRCGEKLAHVREGFGRDRFSVESSLGCARNVTDGSW